MARNIIAQAENLLLTPSPSPFPREILYLVYINFIIDILTLQVTKSSMQKQMDSMVNFILSLLRIKSTKMSMKVQPLIHMLKLPPIIMTKMLNCKGSVKIPSTAVMSRMITCTQLLESWITEIEIHYLVIVNLKTPFMGLTMQTLTLTLCMTL